MVTSCPPGSPHDADRGGVGVRVVALVAVKVHVAVPGLGGWEASVRPEREAPLKQATALDIETYKRNTYADIHVCMYVCR